MLRITYKLKAGKAYPYWWGKQPAQEMEAHHVTADVVACTSAISA